MKTICLMRDNKIVAKMSASDNITDLFMLDLECFLSDNGILPDDAELYVLEDTLLEIPY